MTGTLSTRLSDRSLTLLRTVLVLILLYGFLVGVKALESGIKAFAADFAERLFDNVTHPVAELFADLLATVLVQSSSVSTATMVGLVGAGAGALPLASASASASAVVMGANIGTTVTNTLISLGHVRRGWSSAGPLPGPRSTTSSNRSSRRSP